MNRRVPDRDRAGSAQWRWLEAETRSAAWMLGALAHRARAPAAMVAIVAGL